METPVTDGLIAGMVQALVSAADPEQVILFGSRGRGDQRERSDVDLIVVESQPFRPEGAATKRSRLAAIRPFGGHPGLSRDEVEYRDSINHVLARALREGQVLAPYDRVRLQLEGARRDFVTYKPRVRVVGRRPR